MEIRNADSPLKFGWNERANSFYRDAAVYVGGVLTYVSSWVYVVVLELLCRVLVGKRC